jgi:hypothetical protein
MYTACYNIKQVRTDLSGMHKSQAPCRQEDSSLYKGTWYLLVVSMKPVSGAKNLEMVPLFLVHLCTPNVNVVAP